MKHLLLFIFFSGSLDSFSQDTLSKPTDTIWWVNNPPFSGCLKLCVNPDALRLSTGILVYSAHEERAAAKPDTLRAICLVTLHENGIAVARKGFVVIAQGKRPVYLDCRKRALKMPQVGWDFREVNVNYKQK